MITSNQSTARRSLGRRPFTIESLEPRLPLSAAPLGDGGSDLQDVIVWLQPGASDAGSTGREIAAVHGGQVGHVYQSIPGFSASLPQAALDALQNNPNVASIEPDSLAFLQAQTLPTGIDRADADLNPVAAIDGVPGNANGGGDFPFYVATIDSGIDLEHPDLNIAGGRNFIRGANDTNIDDGNGHGTHVAGTMAALDNAEGVVGLAPGAGVWAVKAFGNNGSGRYSDILAAMDHVVQERVAGTPIAVLNMSFGMMPLDRSASDALLQQMAEAGIVLFGAAGNSGGSGSIYPAWDAHVVSVAALADSDGQAGGLGPDTSAGPDDTIADFSNCCGTFSHPIDIAAPGTDILSTWPKGSGYAVHSGTSMATPHAAGAAALFIAEYAAAWATAGLPGDLLDTVLVREALTETAEASGQFATRQDDPSRGLYVLQADGNWTTPPVASIVSQLPPILQGIESVTVDARDVDTALGNLNFEILLTDSGGLSTSIAPTASYVPADADDPYGSYELTWDTTGISEGQYQLAVVATDAQANVSNPGARLTTNRITVFVDDGVNDPPVVNITSPTAGGGDISGTVPLQADVTDDGTVSSVTFVVADEFGTQIAQIPASETTPATSTTPAVWSAFWDTTGGADGSYSISVTAIDSLGAASLPDAESPITVNNSQMAGTLAVADIDGSAQNDNKKFWTATARTQVRDADGNPVVNAVVYGNWRSSRGGTATTWSPTDADGWVEHHFTKLTDASSPVSYTIDRIEHPDYTYEPLLNADPDGDSTISASGDISISIARDAAAGASRQWLSSAIAAAVAEHDRDPDGGAAGPGFHSAATAGLTAFSPAPRDGDGRLEKRPEGSSRPVAISDRVLAAESAGRCETTDSPRRLAAIDHLFADPAGWALPQLSAELVSDLRA